MAATHRQGDSSSEDAKDVAKDVTPTLARLTTAQYKLASGMAQAIGDGYATAADAITTENIMSIGLDNGMFVGAVRGYARTLEAMPKLLDNYLDSLNK